MYSVEYLYACTEYSLGLGVNGTLIRQTIYGRWNCIGLDKPLQQPYNLSELGYNLFSQDTSETCTEDQRTLELEGLEDSGHLVSYKSTLFKNPVPLQRD